MIAHIMGIPVEESVVQFVPAGTVLVAAVAVFVRTLGERLHRGRRKWRSGPRDAEA